MSSSGAPPMLNDELSRRTAVFGLRLWVLVCIGIGAAFVLLLFLISLYLASRRLVAPKPKPKPKPKPNANPTTPPISKEIQEVIHVHVVDPNMSVASTTALLAEDPTSDGSHRMLHMEAGKRGRIGCGLPDGGGGGDGHHGSGEAGPEVSHLGWGHWYTLRELEAATGDFAAENVVGEGGYGIVYRGVLVDGSQVAVKNLLNNRGQAEREFKVEVETIGRVRHKNLVRLLGYCAEGAHRILIYEFVNNGNLEQWLHGDVGPLSPLTWDIRMNIVLGTAKGLTYLHEGLEPKVVHRDIKSSNILLDKSWNPKVSDFGLAKLLESESSYITTRVMGTFGYVAPEYASTGMLNERSDVYSFGILIMEIISGRSPVDYTRHPGEVNLVEWLKNMVTNRDYEVVLDPKLPEKPSSRALKKALLVALRCVDPDSHKRPKMGHVIHMLETGDFPYRDDRKNGRSYQGSPLEKAKFLEKAMAESGDSSGNESNTSVNRHSRLRVSELVQSGLKTSTTN